jgi:hypothetical protein
MSFDTNVLSFPDEFDISFIAIKQGKSPFESLKNLEKSVNDF